MTDLVVGVVVLVLVAGFGTAAWRQIRRHGRALEERDRAEEERDAAVQEAEQAARPPLSGEQSVDALRRLQDD